RAAALRDALGRPRLYPAGVAGERMVDGAVSAEQHRREVRAEPVGGGPHALLRGLDRADALAREAREGSRPWLQGAGRVRPQAGAELRARGGRVPAASLAAAPRAAPPLRPVAGGRRRRGDRGGSRRATRGPTLPPP